MAIIQCPECSKEISSAAAACPHCGHPMRAQAEAVAITPTWSPGIAVLISLFVPGGGHMYKGQVSAGFGWLVFTVLGYVCFIFPGIFLHIFCMVSAASGTPTKVSG